MNTSFGETLRLAREAKGLTTSQIASKTRMLVQIVEEMENEDFHRIAAPIYGRGFVKLYAECVDLDPLPLVQEFMDIYEGRRAPIVRTREVPVQVPSPASVPPPAVDPAPEPQPAVEPPSSVSMPEPPPMPEPQPDVVPPSEPVAEPPPAAVPPPAVERSSAPPPAVEPEPVPEPIDEPPPVVRGLDLFESAAPHRPHVTREPASPPVRQPSATNTADIFSESPYLSAASAYGGEGPSAADRFRKSLSSVSHGVIQSVREIPRSVWRITLLALATAILLALLAWGCIKLYQATSITPPPSPPAPEVQPDAQDRQDAKAVKESEAKNTGSADRKAVQDVKAPSPAKRSTLRATGQKVPPLYID